MADGYIGPYRILRPLGQGGMGEVLLAVDERLGRRVAVKRLPAGMTRAGERLERFRREARAIAALSHPCIVAIHDIGESDGEPYLVLEHVEGLALSALLREGPVPAVRATKLALQIADALRAAHRIGILHRDVKADNVIVTDEDRVKVLDFGLAKDLSEQAPILGKEPSSLTEPGLVVGSVPYMSPEQLLGEELDFRSDVFSFGVVYFELLTGRRPFAGGTVPVTLHAVLYGGGGAMHEAAAVPAASARVLERCLARDRAARYPDAGALHADLEEVLLALTTTARLAAVSQAAEPVRKPTVAVLPFRNVRPDPDTDYLGPALASSVTERLSTVRSLVVRPSIYVDKYRTEAFDLARVGRELDVVYLVTGQCFRQGDRISIGFELARIDTGTLVLKRTMTLPSDEVMAFPEAVGHEIVRALAVALSPEDEARLARHQPRDAEAYDLYLRSIGLGSDARQSGAALEMVRGSLEMDGEFAPAWVELSRRYNEQLINHFGSADDRDHAIDAARRAVELDSTLGIAAAQLGNLLVDAGRAEEGTEVLRRGMAASPNVANLHEFLAYTYRFAGFLPQALAELQEADRLDPLRSELAQLLVYMGRFRQFLDATPLATTPIRHFYRGFVLFHLGRTSEAVRAFEEAERGDAESQFAMMGQALRHHLQGATGDGLRVLQEVVGRRERNRMWDGEVTYKLAQIAAQLSDLDLSERLFEAAVAQGFFCYPYFARDPLLEPLRAAGRGRTAMRAAWERHDRYRARFFPELPPADPPGA